MDVHPSRTTGWTTEPPPHDALAYLNTAVMGEAVAEALSGPA
ncbi:hypothetical protein [Zafaria cholistanensis]|nr:hypothetical protein [Zafaria cholistanensis]